MDIGKLGDRYTIKLCITSTSMSEVYLAENLKLGNFWVIKKIRKATDDGLIMPKEYDILRLLKHDSIPQIFDIEEDDNFVYILEEYIEGDDIQALVNREGKINPDKTIKIIIQLCDVLNYIHNIKPNPIIHRDIKPSNIIITRSGNLKLIDFGIAREYKADNKNDTMFLGTRGYAAPEQFGHAQTDSRSDIYSTGLLLYYMLTAENPCDSDFSIKPFVESHLNLPKELYSIISKATSIVPQNRYKTAAHLKADLEEVLSLLSVEERTMVLVKNQLNERITSELAKALKDDLKKEKTKRNKMMIRIAVIAVSIIAFVSTGLFIIPNVIKANPTGEEKELTSKSNMDNKIIIGEDVKETANANEKVVHSSPEAPIVKQSESTAPQSPSATFSTEPTPNTASGSLAESSQETIPDNTSTPTSAPTPSSAVTPKPTPQATPKPSSSKVTYLNNLKCDMLQRGNDTYKYTVLSPSTDKDINSRAYTSGITLSFHENLLVSQDKQYIRAQYALNKQYSKLQFVFSVCSLSKNVDSDQKAWINIFTDGTLIKSSSSIGSKDQPITFVVDNLDNVEKIKFEVIAEREFVHDIVFIIGDPILSK